MRSLQSLINEDIIFQYILSNCIPEIGDKITLDADWKFEWINDHRNSDVIFRLSNGLFEYPFVIEGNGHSFDKYLYLIKPSSPKNIQCGEIYSMLTYHKILQSNNHIKIKKILSSMLFESKNESFIGDYDLSEWFQTTHSLNSYKFNIETELSESRITIPKDTVLEIDRIYIRKGLEEYSSISFLVDSSPEVAYKPKADLKKLGLGHITKKHKMRFFAKLKDVNRIEFR